MYESLAQVNLGSPVNWQHPLNRGRVAWFLCLPGMMGGRLWPDLCFPADQSRAGVMTGFTADLHARNSTGGWRQLSRPGGYGNLFISSSLGSSVGAFVPRNILYNLSVFSVSGWIFVDSVSFNDNAIAYCLDHAGTGAGFRLGLDGNTSAKMQFGKEVGSVEALAVANAAHSINKWVHYVGTANSNGLLTLYLNGVKQTATSTAPTGPIIDTINTGLGQTISGSKTNYVDDIGFWNRCLTAAEAMQVYLQSTQGNPDTLNRVARRISVAAGGGGATDFMAFLDADADMQELEGVAA